MGDRWANSSSSLFQYPWNYDVYFSFRGEDTRANFTGHLYNAFRQKGIRVFMDDDEEIRGEEISQALIKGMEQSRISIIIFSKNYGSSTCCLDELAKIMEFRKTKGQLVIPVFYHVYAPDVRHQRESFAEAMIKHKHRFKADSERVQRWRLALHEAANLFGWQIEYGHDECEYVQKITEAVMSRLASFRVEANNLRECESLTATIIGDRANSSSSSQHLWNYDVNFSFRGEDTRRNFVAYLDKAFCDKGINVFSDDRVQRGEEISQALTKGIEQSRISIIIFSQNYASSTWCLNELAMIMECRKTKGQLVIPVFYHIDPSGVRCQTGSCKDAFAKPEHRSKADSERVQRWRSALNDEAAALKDAANLPGWHLGYGFKYEFEYIQHITEHVIRLIGGLKSLNAKGENLRRNISNWKKGKLLGRGSFGSVYEAINEDGFFFAIKEAPLPDQGSRGNQVFSLEREIAVLSMFEHKNIVKYYGTKRDQSNMYVFLELATQGSLVSLYQTYTLEDSIVSAYTRQILHGLKYLHDQNVIHRDIKCANILVDADGSVKLADFGLAKITESNDIKSSKGTPFWMAPEVIKITNERYDYGLPADIWSLGCTVLEMFTGKAPYAPLGPIQAIYKIGNGERPPLPENLPRDARDFILQCLEVNPNDRPTAADLLNHPFVNRSLSQSSGAASPYINPGRKRKYI